MDPNVQNTNPQPAPEAQPSAPQPVQPSVPPPAPQPSQPAQPAPVAPAVPPATPKSKKPLLLIGGIIMGILVFLAGIAFVWMLFLSPAAQAKRASNTFMKALTANDTEKVFTLTNTTDDSAKQYLSGAAEKSQGSFSLKSGTMKDGKGYFLYTLSNNNAKMGRTTVEKQDGKWLVTGYTYGSDNLALVPSGSSTSDSSQSPSATANQKAVAITGCLSKDAISKVLGFDAVAENKGSYNQYYFGYLYFNSQSTDYSDADQASRSYDKLASLYKDNDDKSFTIRLRGKVFGTGQTARGIELSHQRAAKVKQDLEALGVPADRVVEDSVQKVTSTYNDGSERNVEVYIRVDKSCK
jgi:hypothetical protein